MPRMRLTREEKLSRKLAFFITSEMKEQGITFEVMSDVLGISRQTFSKKLESGHLTMVEMVKVFHKLDTDSKDIEEIFKE